MCERYPGYLFGGTPVSSWDRSFNSLENQIQQQYRGRAGAGARCWGSMSEGGGVSAAGGDSCKTNLIVNYLPQTMTEKDLYAMFMSIGPIESCRVMKDFKTGYSYGFGFVNFTREEDAARAIDTFNGYQLRNKRLKVSYARPSGDDIKDTNLYVTNLPRAITEEQLETIFGKYGRIVQKHILRDKSNGTPRGVAFVRFDKREEAQEAIAALNNVIPEGGTEPLSVKVAEEHGKQKAAYYAGWAAGFHHNRVIPQRLAMVVGPEFASTRGYTPIIQPKGPLDRTGVETSHGLQTSPMKNVTKVSDAGTLHRHIGNGYL
ncbi:sex-lethal homolog isoform X3 [Anticarsia gemmatalis]|uniref:sex-lethal homolog isoform X3 n=1 Tax=Anticarsia gemmatalis TaxID=129554 RepID=UPI003F768350